VGVGGGPTASTSPTASPRPSVFTGSTENWVDSLGDGYNRYEINSSPGCAEYAELFGGEMGPVVDNCCYCYPNREGGSSTERANNEGGISIDISIDIPTKGARSFLEDLTEWICPDETSIGDKSLSS